MFETFARTSCTIPSSPTGLILNSCSDFVEHAFTPPSAECTHTEYEDRAFTGTWVMHEVRLCRRDTV